MPFKKQHPLYSTWQGMIRRCDTPTTTQFRDYGGRGITVCERWRVFANFLEDMGARPEGHTIERVDNNGNYEPSNCCWASRKAQQRNRRNGIVTVTIEGVDYVLAALAESSQLKRDTIQERALKGLTLQEVLDPARRVSRRTPVEAIAKRLAKVASKTHCARGHLLDEANTHKTKEGWRQCRRCAADKQKGYREANRDW
jgi:hypothetical protein